MSKKLAVLGSPITHSKSPQIQLAALSRLGVEATFERIEVSDLASWQASNSVQFDALSLTMPLKEQARTIAVSEDDLVKQTNSANYLLRSEDGYKAFNTDVFGIGRSTAAKEFSTIAVLGTGASARSAIAAFADRAPVVWGRASDKVAAVSKEYSIQAASLETALRCDLVISTLPGNALADLVSDKQPGTLFDIVYSRPSPAGFQGYIPGIHMLIWQAIGQLRWLVTGTDAALPDEESLFELMLDAAEMAE